MSFGGIGRKLAAMLRRGEYLAVAEEISSRVLPTGNPVLYWDKFVLVELREARPVPLRESWIPAIATGADVDALCRHQPDRAALYRRRMDENQTCLVMKDAGRIVASMWVIAQRTRYATNSGLHFAPPAAVGPSAWCHDVYIDPAYRLRGLFVAFMRHVAAPGAGGGRPTTLYGEIHFLNHHSRRSHERLGFKVIRDVTFVSVLGLKAYVIKDDHGRITLAHRYALRVPHN